MWYTPKEHGSRHSVRFAGNFIAALIGAMIAYGVLHYDDGFSQWRLLCVIYGLITIVWSVILWFNLPNSPFNARFLTANEKEFASLRSKKFQHSTHTRKWERRQFFETFYDSKTYWFFLFAIVLALPNTGLTNFSSLIIKGFGYNKYKTVLLSHPTASFQLVTVVAGAVLTTIFRKSRLIILTSMYIIAISGALMINRRRNRAQRVHIDAEERQKVDLMRDDVLPRVDETDMKNLGFRYIL